MRPTGHMGNDPRTVRGPMSSTRATTQEQAEANGLKNLCEEVNGRPRASSILAPHGGASGLSFDKYP